MAHDDDARGEYPILQLRHACKSFGHVVALEDAFLEAHVGEVVAIVGDNGAGKSTMIKVLAGVHEMDVGELLIDGLPVSLPNPAAAQAHGISTVFQDLALIESLDVAANMYLGRPLRKAWFFADRKAMVDGAADTIRSLKVRVPSVRVSIGVLSGGQRQGVAIARAVHQQGRIILMDEPTAALGYREKRQVIDIIKQLREREKVVVVISHDLELVFEVADRIQVMRLGRIHGVRRREETDHSEVVGMITGAIGVDADATPGDVP